jgi:lipid II:glycine glycyltransferase (peptidoglycan interpeptide bridge formation enzyme)
MPEIQADEWERFLQQWPDAHLLQTAAWGELKADFGWQPIRVAVSADCGAQILLRRFPIPLSLAYIPKGPVGKPSPAFWREVDAVCRKHRAVFLKVEADAFLDPAGPEPGFPPGFILSQECVQPRRTLIIDLTGDEEDMLARMKQKTRYNIKLALKKGVVVRASGDVDTFHRLLRQTGERDKFGVHTLAYYRRAYELFHQRGQGELLMAEYEGDPLAGLMVFSAGQRAWYLYGASASDHRDRMPTYLLQWEAMRWARAHGCTSYDLWGVPDEENEALETQFTSQHDGLWGVYRFKRGFGGELKRAVPTIDRIYMPMFYRLYRRLNRRREAAL